MIMYNSLKAWIDVPIGIKPYVSRDSANHKTFGTVVDALCYPEEKVRKVVNASGDEVISSTTLYMEPSSTISTEDEIIYNNVSCPIKAKGAYYRNGVVDIMVVYV